jgi:2-polyprenyl-6-methoxyphenol hydroxylase-like FAD-dependent oxidoreductase
MSRTRIFAEIGSDERPTGSPVTLGTVVVLGGSIAGMLAARVLADHAERVLIVERDVVAPGDTSLRKGAPQGSQIHGLLPAGSRQLERWFPGFWAAAVADGAVPNPLRQRASYHNGARKVAALDIDVLMATRPFLESHIRRSLAAWPRVTTIAGRVTGLVFDDTAVVGVRVGDVVHEADLVVDAMGRASKVSDWLTAAGWDAPPLTRQQTGVNYATAFFARPPEAEPMAVLALFDARVGGDLNGAMLAAVEGDRWIVMMGGYGACRPGNTAADMIRRCREQFPAEFAEVAANTMLGEPVTYRQADSRRRDYAGAKRLPGGVVAVGDAVASFNPVYGQGMSSAALHASCLSMWLRSGRPVRYFYDLQQLVVDAAWGLSTSSDLDRPSVNAPRPPGHRLTSWLTSRILQATVTDPVVGRSFDEVVSMVRHPADLVSMPFVTRSLWTSRGSGRSRPLSPDNTTR